MSRYQGNEPFNDFIETVNIGIRFWNILSPDVILTYDSKTRSFNVKYGKILHSKDESGTITLTVISSGGSVYIITRERGVYSAHSSWTWLRTERAYIRWDRGLQADLPAHISVRFDVIYLIIQDGRAPFRTKPKLIYTELHYFIKVFA